MEGEEVGKRDEKDAEKGGEGVYVVHGGVGAGLQNSSVRGEVWGGWSRGMRVGRWRGVVLEGGGGL